MGSSGGDDLKLLCEDELAQRGPSPWSGREEGLGIWQMFPKRQACRPPADRRNMIRGMAETLVPVVQTRALMFRQAGPFDQRHKMGHTKPGILGSKTLTPNFEPEDL